MRAEALKIETKKRLFAKLQGEHSSIFSGSGKEFLELKEYSSSDSAKHINWKRSTTAQSPLVNIYGDERELNIVVVYLVSGSLLFDEKRDIAREVCSILSFSATAAKERLNLLFFANKELAYYQNIRENGFDIAYDLVSKIEHKAKEIDFNNLSNFLSATLQERSIIFLVGDFLQDGVDLSKISHLHEVYAIAIRSKKEEHLRAIGEANLQDALTLKSRSYVITKRVANSYNQEFKKQDDLLKSRFIKEGISFTKIYKSSDTILELQRALGAM